MLAGRRRRAAQAGECVHVAGIGGILVPTQSEFGPEGDTGIRIDWTAYDADPTPRHRLEMLDLRQIERQLQERMRQHSEQLETTAGHPWDRQTRADAEAALRHAAWGLPDRVPVTALRVIATAAAASDLATRAASLTAFGSHGVDVPTAGRREQLLRALGSDSDSALAQATNVAVMALAGWRPA